MSRKLTALLMAMFVLFGSLSLPVGALERTPCPNHSAHDETCGGLDGTCTHSCEQCQPKDTTVPVDPIVLTAIPALAENVAQQTKPVGTPLDQLGLPTTLAATKDSGETILVEGVLWQSEPAYTPDVAGTYLFTAILPETYTLGDQAITLPVIKITLGEDLITGTVTSPVMNFRTTPSRAGRSISPTLPADGFSSFGAQLTGDSITIYQQLENSDMINEIKISTASPAETTFPSTQFAEKMKEYISTNIFPAFFDAMAAMDRDHPEIFWLDKAQSAKVSYTAQSNGATTTCTSMTLTFVPSLADYTAAQIPGIQSQLNAQISSIASGQSDYELVKSFHDWLVSNNDYNPTVAKGGTPATGKPWELVSALLSGEKDGGPVCEGYSRAFKALCDSASIPCILVSGTGSGGVGAGAHMWNYVKLNGAWYPVDVTWDDPIGSGGGGVRYDNFLVAGSKFNATHKNNGVFTDRSGMFQYPVLSAAAFDPSKVVTKVTGTPTLSENYVYGQKLSDKTLSGTFTAVGTGATVAGQLTWQVPNQVYAVGTHNAAWTFTPDDVNTYSPLSGTISVQVNPLPVTITLSGDLNVTYNGQPQGLTATCAASNPSTPIPAGIVPNVTITYDGSADRPVDAGTYAVVASLTGQNLTAENATASLVVNPKQLELSAYTLSIANGFADSKIVPLAQFGIPADLVAKVSVSVTADASSILSKAPTLADGGIVIAIKSDAAIGQTAKVKVVLNDKNYTVQPAELTVQVTAEGYRYTLIKAPKTVKLGEEIDLSGFQVKTDYDSGKPSTTDTVTPAMISGYDKAAIGVDSIGKKSIKVKLDASRDTSFEIEVLDVTTDILVVSPAQSSYRWGIDTKLNLTDGTVQAIKRSTIAQPVVPMTIQMISATDATIQDVGDYPVAVTYEGIKKVNAFTLRVRAESGIVDNANKLTDGVPGVAVKLPDDASDIDRTNLSILNFTVEPGDAQQFAQTLQNMLGFVAMDIKLVNTTGGSADLPKGTEYTIMLPFPRGTDRTYLFKVLHLVDGSMKEEKFTTTANGLLVEASSLSPFAVAYQKGTSKGDTDTTRRDIDRDRDRDEAYDGYYDGHQFWVQVSNQLRDMEKGTLKVEAKGYDKVAWNVIERLRENPNLVLEIDWYGKIIRLQADNLEPYDGHIYFPLSLLYEKYNSVAKKTESAINPATGGGIVFMSAPKEAEGLAITPADRGKDLSLDAADDKYENQIAVNLSTESAAAAPVETKSPVVGIVLLVSAIVLALGSAVLYWFNTKPQKRW